MAEIGGETKNRRNLPNWLLILLTIGVAVIAWWYVANYR
jgi:hypothetical protein